MSRALSAVERLASRLTARVGVPVTVTLYAGTGQETALSITAIVGNEQTPADTPGGGNARIVETDRDYVITVSDLVYNGSAITPPKGMRIAETIGGVVHTFEMRPTGGEPGWRHSDDTRVMYRIHTKRVS